MKRRRNFDKKYHYVYLITNTINGKQYIGYHSTDNLDDGYMGSGKLLSKAFLKYNKEKFKKEILEHFNSRYKAFKAQKKYIEKYNTIVPNGYNLHKGGGRNPLALFDSIEQIDDYFKSLKGVHYSSSEDPIIHISLKSKGNDYEENQNRLKKAITWYKF